MKKLLISLAVGLMVSGGAYAACQGPYCYGDGTAQLSEGLELLSFTTGQLLTMTPSRSGILVGVTQGNGPKIATVCVSTGTGRGAYTVLQSTTLVANTGMPACY